MTRGRKFHSRNRRLAQIDWGTVSGAIRWLELPFYESNPLGRSESELDVAP
jgi:hypothetical protein